MEHKKVLVNKDYHDNTNQESPQAHGEKHRKLLSELWNQKYKLEAIDKQTQSNLYSGGTLGTEASVPWIEVPPD